MRVVSRFVSFAALARVQGGAVDLSDQVQGLANQARGQMPECSSLEVVAARVEQVEQKMNHLMKAMDQVDQALGALNVMQLNDKRTYREELGHLWVFAVAIAIIVFVNTVLILIRRQH